MFSVTGLGDELRPRQKVRFGIKRKDGQTEEIDAILRIDTAIEVDYYQHGGILPYVLRELLRKAA
jgi:aconitate hydratase